MTVEAPGAPTLGGPTVGGLSSVEGPGISGGGLSIGGGEVSSPAAFQLAFDFGQPHQVSGEIFSADKVVPQPESIFDTSLFEVVAKPQSGAEKPNLTEIFGPKVGLMGPSVTESPVSLPERVFDESFFETLVQVRESPPTPGAELVRIPNPQSAPTQPAIEEPPSLAEGPPPLVVEGSPAQTVSDLGEDKTKLKKELEEKGELFKKSVPLKLKTVWQILTGEIKQSQTALLGKIEVEEQTAQEEIIKEETVVATQPAVLGEDGGEVKVKVGVDGKDQPEDPQEPKEPLWALSSKTEDRQVVDGKVLNRRLKVAQEVVTGAVKESESQAEAPSLISAVAARLGKIDQPTFKEAVRMIFGRLTFPFLAGQAKTAILTLTREERTPKVILETLQETLIRQPPLDYRRGKIESEGYLPESQLVKIARGAARLAQKGAEHIIYEPQTGRWASVPKRQSQSPLELDKTKKKVPVTPERKISPWHALFIKRKEVRAARNQTPT